jgi:hypothetical protein
MTNSIVWKLKTRDKISINLNIETKTNKISSFKNLESMNDLKNHKYNYENNKTFGKNRGKQSHSTSKSKELLSHLCRI